MSKRRQEKTNNIGVVKCIKDKDMNILFQDEKIKNRYRKYFDELFNIAQGHVVGDTTINPLNENREFKRK